MPARDLVSVVMIIYLPSFHAKRLTCLELDSVTEKVKASLERIDNLLQEDENQEKLVQVSSSRMLSLFTSKTVVNM